MITNLKKSLLGIVEDNSTHNSSISGYLWKLKHKSSTSDLIPQWTKRWFTIEGIFFLIPIIY
jgi:hypothetical protein